MNYIVKQEGDLTDVFPYQIYDGKTIVALVSNLEDANKMASALELYKAVKGYRDTLDMLLNQHPDDKILAAQMYQVIQALPK